MVHIHTQSHTNSFINYIHQKVHSDKMTRAELSSGDIQIDWSGEVAKDNRTDLQINNKQKSCEMWMKQGHINEIPCIVAAGTYKWNTLQQKYQRFSKHGWDALQEKKNANNSKRMEGTGKSTPIEWLYSQHCHINIFTR